MAADPAQTFREEAAELLVALEDALLNLEQSPDDRNTVDTAFRALHTIKGSGAMFGFDAVAAFTHHLENAFDLVRKGQLPATSSLIGLGLAAKDHIRALIEDPHQADPAIGQELLAKLAEMVGGTTTVTAVVSAPAPREPARQATWRIRFSLAADMLERGTNPLLLLDELRALGPATVVALTDRVPGLEDLDPFALYIGWDVILTTSEPRSVIDDVFIFVIDDMELKIDQIESGGERLGDILVNRGEVAPEVVEAALGRQERLGVLLVKDGEVSEDKVRSALAEQQHLRREAEDPRATAGSIRVPAERLDGLMDQVGELVIAQARLKQVIAGGDLGQIKVIAEEIERLSNGLRDTTMGIRMVPIGSLFARFRRLIRDLSQDLGKDMVLTMAGEDTELDKTMIERLTDPLVHLIRNAADHGIEPPDERIRAGKPVQGQIHLAAVHAGAQVLITVKDDGRGMNPVKIRAKAEEVGLIPPSAVLSESEVLELVLQPGFSTAARVTSVSGRGVGMDVVKRNIDSLRGTIAIDSHFGSGSDVTLRLPLTLAIIDGLLVRVGRGRYVIPLAAVEECVELSAADNCRSSGRSFLNIRGDLVPFLRLRELFHTDAPVEPYQKIVVVSTADQRIGLVVDQLIGEHQTVIKSLSRLHADIQTFSGATILGDGTVALILDVPHLIELGQINELRQQVS
jgi:two-component system, chemotaxis family, sensor kinase CheA